MGADLIRELPDAIPGDELKSKASPGSAPMHHHIWLDQLVGGAAKEYWPEGSQEHPGAIQSVGHHLLMQMVRKSGASETPIWFQVSNFRQKERNSLQSCGGGCNLLAGSQLVSRTTSTTTTTLAATWPVVTLTCHC